MERLPIYHDAVEVSHLAVRFELPEEPVTPFAILYLHGFGSRQTGEKADFFRGRALLDGIPFASFDFQGHGESGGSLRELTVTRNLGDVARVAGWLAARGWEHLALFGSSMGGATALWHAALYPETVVAATHVAPALGMRRGFERWAGAEGLARWQREGSIRFRGELVEADLGWTLMDDLERYPIEDLVAQYRTPTLIFQGQRDASVDWRDVEDFARRAPAGVVDLRLLPEGDHRLIDNKADLWEEARDFLIAAASAYLPPEAR